jgi:hypothetical protein
VYSSAFLGDCSVVFLGGAVCGVAGLGILIVSGVGTSRAVPLGKGIPSMGPCESLLSGAGRPPPPKILSWTFFTESDDIGCLGAR